MRVFVVLEPQGEESKIVGIFDNRFSANECVKAGHIWEIPSESNGGISRVYARWVEDHNILDSFHG